MHQRGDEAAEVRGILFWRKKGVPVSNLQSALTSQFLTDPTPICHSQAPSPQTQRPRGKKGHVSRMKHKLLSAHLAQVLADMLICSQWWAFR